MALHSDCFERRFTDSKSIPPLRPALTGAWSSNRKDPLALQMKWHVKTLDMNIIARQVHPFEGSRLPVQVCIPQTARVQKCPTFYFKCEPESATQIYSETLWVMKVVAYAIHYRIIFPDCNSSKSWLAHRLYDRSNFCH